MNEGPGTMPAPAQHAEDSALAADATRLNLGALYQLHGKAMHESAGAVMRSAGLASSTNDIVQEVVVKLMGKPLPNNVSNWEAFLRTAARNKALDVVKSAAVKRHGGGLEDAPEPADSVDVEEVAIRALEVERLTPLAAECLSILNPRQRRLLWEVEGLERSQAAVAADLDVTPARVSQIRKEALKLVRDEAKRRAGGQHNG